MKGSYGTISQNDIYCDISPNLDTYDQGETFSGTACHSTDIETKLKFFRKLVTLVSAVLSYYS